MIKKWGYSDRVGCCFGRMVRVIFLKSLSLNCGFLKYLVLGGFFLVGRIVEEWLGSWFVLRG